MAEGGFVALRLEKLGRGFAWLDLSDVRSVPCAQTAFADRSFHPDASCSMMIRRRLDEAVRRER